jgi:hypothetical protein
LSVSIQTANCNIENRSRESKILRSRELGDRVLQLGTVVKDSLARTSNIIRANSRRDRKAQIGSRNRNNPERIGPGQRGGLNHARFGQIGTLSVINTGNNRATEAVRDSGVSQIILHVKLQILDVLRGVNKSGEPELLLNRVGDRNILGVANCGVRGTRRTEAARGAGRTIIVIHVNGNDTDAIKVKGSHGEVV